MPKTDSGRAVWISICTFAFLMWIAGNRLVLVNDEGIYLDGAVRVLGGSLPYRDFFALTGPGTFWNLALLFKVLGATLASARVLLACDLAVICACMYWLTAQCVSSHAGVWLWACYLGLLSADAGNLTVNHRWDSAALGIAAAALAFHGIRSGRRWEFAAAGALSAYAAWVTPPAIAAGVVLAAWCAWRSRFQDAAWLCAGGAAVSAAAMAALWWTGSLTPLLAQLLWTGSNYSGANRFLYGAVIGGYAQLFSEARGVEWATRAALVGLLALPAIAPVVAGLGLFKRRSADSLFLLACSGAAVASCYPRLDIGHLVFAAPMTYVAATCSVAGVAGRRARMGLAVALASGAFLFGTSAVAGRARLSSMSARAGPMAGEQRELALVRSLERNIANGEDFFAFPYLPLAYFLTQARNPTRYSFLQPGMMAESDEADALARLRESPPLRILYLDVAPEAYLRLFPSSDAARLRMHRIEAWLRDNYEASALAPDAAYRLLVRRAMPSNILPVASD